MATYCIPMSIHQATDIPLNEVIDRLPNGNGSSNMREALDALESFGYNVDFVYFKKRGRKRRELREAVRDGMLDKGTYILALFAYGPPQHAVCVRNGKISDNGSWYSKTPKSIWGRASISADTITVAIKIKRGRRRSVSRAVRNVLRRIHPDDLPYIYE